MTQRGGISDWVTQKAIEMMVQQGLDPFAASNDGKLALCMGFVLGRLYETSVKEPCEAKQQAQQIATLREALTELYALARGECPRLLNEDSGGDAQLAMKIEQALAKEYV